jgi:tRNA splicing ligase
MIFGENMQGNHSIEYDLLTSWFYMFGCRQETDNGFQWASWDDVETFAYALGVPTVPVLFKGSVSSVEELESVTMEILSQGSKLGPEIEGLVVRAADSFSDEYFPLKVMKWVRKGHVTTDQHWTKNWKQATIKP